MQKDSSIKEKIPLRQRIILIIFGLFLFLVLLETGLRLGGFVILALQEQRNRISISHKGSYRIMCLGESTTAGQWPYLLEKILNQRNIGIRFSVVDKAIGATNTEFLLSQLESNLNDYHPNMVITMMGINDVGVHMPHEAPTNSRAMRFFKSFRTYKLARLLWLHMVTKAKAVRLYNSQKSKEYATDVLIGVSTPQLVNNLYIPGREVVQKGDSFKKAAEGKPYNDRALVESGWSYQRQGKYPQAEESFKRAIELNPGNEEAHRGLGFVYMNQGKYSQAEESFKRAIKSSPLNERPYRALGSYYKEMRNFELAKEYEMRVKELSCYASATVNNYHKLREILMKKGVRLVCVQYPVRSLLPLKEIFKGDREVIFVDNEKIFKEALSKSHYGDYFTDMFGGDFGHCTYKGNRLLAENIANVILREVFNK